jgi:hypothetical protein
MLATYRPTEAPSDDARRRLEELPSLGTRFDVTGLDDAGLSSLVASVIGQPLDDDALGVLQQRTGGNPLFSASLNPKTASNARPRASAVSTT